MGLTIGVLSDTHLRGVSGELKRIYRDILQGSDMILHAGDVVSLEVVDFLSSGPFHGVHGNMDPAEVRGRLPRKKIIQAGHYRIGLIHGWGAVGELEDRIWDEFPDVDAIVYGHSHLPANHVRSGVLLFNPGSATGFSAGGNNAVGLLECGDVIEGHILEV